MKCRRGTLVGIVDPLADPERDGRRGRREDHVHAVVEDAAEIPGDERPHALRTAVVLVVVAGRQRVGAQHDPPLDLGAEPGRAGSLHRSAAVDGARRAHAVSHAVVAGEVARGLGRGEDVVGGIA